MSLQQHIDKIQTLKKEIEALPPLTAEQEQDLWTKYRLEWNYNSNHIEGNTLTYGETKLLLIFDKTIGNKDMRELEEMKAHDVAIKLVREWAADQQRPISEAEIRQLNKIILVRPFYRDAIERYTKQKTRKLITPGVYKEQPNHVELPNGEIFKYAEPDEVPIKMGELMKWYLEKEDVHPVVKAAVLHYKLVLIHPFDDGNGRVCRLLMNYHLLKNGYAPIIIKSADKKNYLTALNRADAGDLNAFVEYIAAQLPYSMELHLKALKGESLEEPDDLEKELALIERQLKAKAVKQPVKSKQKVKELSEDFIFPFFELLVKELSRFDQLFDKSFYRILYNGNNTKAKDNMIHKNIIMKGIEESGANSLGLIYRYDILKNSVEALSVHLNIGVVFNRGEYIIQSESLNIKKRLKYNELFDEEKQKAWINELKKYILNQIKKAANA